MFQLSILKKSLLYFKAMQLCVSFKVLKLRTVSHKSFLPSRIRVKMAFCQKSDTDRIAKNLLKQNPS